MTDVERIERFDDCTCGIVGPCPACRAAEDPEAQRERDARVKAAEDDDAHIEPAPDSPAWGRLADDGRKFLRAVRVAGGRLRLIRG